MLDRLSVHPRYSIFKVFRFVAVRFGFVGIVRISGIRSLRPAKELVAGALVGALCQVVALLPEGKGGVGHIRIVVHIRIGIVDIVLYLIADILLLLCNRQVFGELVLGNLPHPVLALFQSGQGDVLVRCLLHQIRR